MARSSSQSSAIDKLISQDKDLKQIFTKSKEPLNVIRNSNDGTVTLAETKPTEENKEEKKAAIANKLRMTTSQKSDP